ncbi:MAG: TolC family protein, partial [Verrucomicrobiota bacterium]
MRTLADLMPPRHSALIALLLSVLLLQSCTIVGVDYDAPEIPTPDAWTVSLQGDVKQGSPNLTKWWTGFHDPVLDQLIERTRDGNPEFWIAAQSIAESRAQRGIAQSQLFPAVTAQGNRSRNRTSENSFGTTPQNPSNLFSGGFDTGWEIDVFGGLRRNVEAAKASIDASVENYRDLLVTLFAETALTYVEYRTIEERIRVAEKNLAAQNESLRLAQSRLDNGLAPKIDVTQATTSLETTRSSIPQLKGQLAQARNRLATLTGDYPANLGKLLSHSRPIPELGKQFTVGLPADLIRARP